MASKKWQLNKEDFEKQAKSALVWLAPMALLYLGQLLFNLEEKKVLELVDLIPNQQTIGAIELYVINQLFGLFTKLKAGK